ncbi:hypothetical protein PBRA_008606 [Plasmodiophora brassicae]|uniref:Uncharacterized protein n=1 Tax=Plasmodiophora brassicae TaxID=37360 RepID=A0A0G4J2V2_PLABS|nr:hypothetical protein PBRA_008606 [Plasmodiophora brassicae]
MVLVNTLLSGADAAPKKRKKERHRHRPSKADADADERGRKRGKVDYAALRAERVHREASESARAERHARRRRRPDDDDDDEKDGTEYHSGYLREIRKGRW